MAKPLDNPSSRLIGELGGVQLVADTLGKGQGAVRNWAHRNTVPRSVWPDLLAAFPRKLTLEKLRAVETERAA